jgi:serine/threonine-protein kinase RsbW
MILFNETRPATLENVRWMRKHLARRLEDSCLRSIDPKLFDRRLTLSLTDSILLSITELANNAVQHADPKPSFLSVEVRVVGAALRIEFRNDGGPFRDFSQVLESAGRVRHSADLMSGRGLSLVSQSLQDLEYMRGNPNRLVGWRKLRRARPHVLIVAEESADGKHLKTMLSQNYNATCVRSASEARLVLQGQRIDVILADYNPKRHWETPSQASFEESPVPIVIMASPKDFDAIKVHPSYIDQCLPKPISTSSLIAAIEIAIASYTRRLIHLANYFGRSAGVLLASELPPAFPGFKLEALSGTASYGGGDFGLALCGKGFTRLVLADIMGHGLKAKAGAIALSSILRAMHCQVSQSADVLLRNVSKIVAQEPAFTDIISTMIVVDAYEDGWIETACAGHPPIAVISEDKSFVLPVTGPLPGVLPHPVYQLASHQLRPGDKIAIITDGIDIQSSATASFPEQLLDRLSRDPQEPLAGLKTDMEQWLAGRLGPAPKDDWTLMIAEYAGKQAPALRTIQGDAARLPQPSNL